eukprot:g9146.t1
MLTKHLAKVLTEMYACMLFREMVRRGPAICCLAALSWRIAVLEDPLFGCGEGKKPFFTEPDIRTSHAPHPPNPGIERFSACTRWQDDVIELVLTGQLLATNAEPGKSTSQISQPSSLPLRPSVELQDRTDGPAFLHDSWPTQEGPRGTTTNELLWHTLHLKQFRSHEPLQSIESEPPRDEGCHRRSDQEWVPDASVAEADKPVLVSALSSIPNCEVEQYCGFVTVHMIKELRTQNGMKTVNVTRQFESLQVFYHQFVAEALLTAKAHVLAVGGDALLGYRINNLFLREDPAGARVKELQRIDAENQRLLKRLQGTKAAVNMSKLDKEHKVQQQYMRMHCEHPKEDWLLERAQQQSLLAAQMAVRAASKALPPPISQEPPGPSDAECQRLLRLQAETDSARSKPKVAPTRAPKQRPSKAARSDELGAKSRAGPRRQRKRKAEEAEPEEFEDPDEDSWSCGHDEPETVSEDDSED